jgi:hypothetical protein
VAVSRAPGDTGTPHADTHGQAEPVFGLAALLGIKLLPRMRTWQDVTFYRVDRETTYQYVDALLAQVVDWDLIERHGQEMMQVVLSIQASRVLPSMLLQKLGVYSRRNALYKAFCELGRVERTIFLLESMSIQPCGSISARRPRKSNLTISLPSGWRLVDRSCAVGAPWSRRSGSSIEIWWLTP